MKSRAGLSNENFYNLSPHATCDAFTLAIKDDDTSDGLRQRRFGRLCRDGILCRDGTQPDAFMSALRMNRNLSVKFGCELWNVDFGRSR
jgi:hypothetical protein